MLGELFLERHDDTRTGREFVLPCERCRFIVSRWVLNDSRRKREISVLQTIDLDTGKVLPAKVRIFVGADMRRRDGDRGGTMLDPAGLLAAIARLDHENAVESDLCHT